MAILAVATPINGNLVQDVAVELAPVAAEVVSQGRDGIIYTVNSGTVVIGLGYPPTATKYAYRLNEGDGPEMIPIGNEVDVYEMAVEGAATRTAQQYRGKA